MTISNFVMKLNCLAVIHTALFLTCCCSLLSKVLCMRSGNDEWSEWSQWICPVTCGGGLGKRTRVCQKPYRNSCPGSNEEQGSCNEQLCPDVLFTLSPETKYHAEKTLQSSRFSYAKNSGESITMNCDSNVYSSILSEYPGATLSWLKNGDVLDTGNSKIRVSGSSLTISDLKPEDNGVYLCRANLASRSVQAVNLMSLVVRTTTPTMLATHEESLTLMCNGVILGRLMPNLNEKWYHNGSVFRDFGQSNPASKNELTLDKVAYADSGVWICKISSNFYTWETNLITVLVVPKVTVLHGIAQYKVHIIVGVSCVVVLLIILCCYIRFSKSKQEKELEAEIKLLGPKSPSPSPEPKPKLQLTPRLPDKTFIKALNEKMKKNPPNNAFAVNQYTLAMNLPDSKVSIMKTKK